MEIPKIFWKYYDLYRRKQISIEEFETKTGLSSIQIDRLLQEISKTPK